MPLTAEQRRERRARAIAENHGPGFRPPPRGPPPKRFPNWDGINGVWRNNAGETAASAADRQRLHDAVWQAKARKQRRQTEYGTSNFSSCVPVAIAVLCAALGFLLANGAVPSPRRWWVEDVGERAAAINRVMRLSRAHGRVLPPTEQARATGRTQTQPCGAPRLPTHPTSIDFSLAVWETTEDIEGRMEERRILDRTWVAVCEPKRRRNELNDYSAAARRLFRKDRAFRSWMEEVRAPRQHALDAFDEFNAKRGPWQRLLRERRENRMVVVTTEAEASRAPEGRHQAGDLGDWGSAAALLYKNKVYRKWRAESPPDEATWEIFTEKRGPWDRRCRARRDRRRAQGGRDAREWRRRMLPCERAAIDSSRAATRGARSRQVLLDRVPARAAAKPALHVRAVSDVNFRPCRVLQQVHRVHLCMPALPSRGVSKTVHKTNGVGASGEKRRPAFRRAWRARGVWPSPPLGERASAVGSARLRNASRHFPSFFPLHDHGAIEQAHSHSRLRRRERIGNGCDYHDLA